MAFEAPITIAKALDRIHRREYMLPAIQREFIWGRDKITRLFDSLMRGYARRVLRILRTRQRSALLEATEQGTGLRPSTMRESKDSSWRFPPLVAPPRSSLRPSPDGGVQPD